MSSRINSFGILIVLMFSVCAVTAALKEGDEFPSLLSAQLDGPLPVLRGKVVLLDFWASWCGPCKKSFPELEKLFKEYKERGFVLLGVNVDDDVVAMREFLKNHAVSFPVVHDKEHRLVRAAGVESMPTSYLVDRSGRIHSIHSGFLGEQTVLILKQEIEKLFNEK